MRYSDLPPGVSIFNENINPREDCVNTCGAQAEGEKDESLECGGMHECIDQKNHESPEHECACGETWEEMETT